MATSLRGATGRMVVVAIASCCSFLLVADRHCFVRSLSPPHLRKPHAGGSNVRLGFKARQSIPTSSHGIRTILSGDPTATGKSSLSQTEIGNEDHDGESSTNQETPNATHGHPPPRKFVDDEYFSVAPMMGHTNRHYRAFVRLFSSRTHLYTEMIPASQIGAAYRRARNLYLPAASSNTQQKQQPYTRATPDPDEIAEVVERVLADPSLEYRAAGDRWPTLHQLLASSNDGGGGSPTFKKRENDASPTVLQLGGTDPDALGVAAAIGAAWGRAESAEPTYSSINLNCGCPSNAVGGRSGGCALMGTPDVVARSVASMKESIENVWKSVDCRDSHPRLSHPPPSVTVKHRLGIREARSFDATLDRTKNDDEAFDEAAAFVRVVSAGGAVPKFHVHTRLGLLGDFGEDDDDNNDDGNKTDKSQTLWVPGSPSNKNKNNNNNDNDNDNDNNHSTKIDHKRAQERARWRARRATVRNRDVPPLRPGVVPRLAEAFPDLRFVANGGINDLDRVEDVVRGRDETQNENENENQKRVLGAMVGRAFVNHPCSFAAADRVLWGDDSGVPPTRGEVLSAFIDYCEKEESWLEAMGAGPKTMDALRTQLIAVPFHLFVGEAGSDAFQRRVLKLRDKVVVVGSGTKTNTNTNSNTRAQPSEAQRKRPYMTASSVLRAAASFVPRDTLDKSVEDFVPWDEMAHFEGGLKRGSALQRVVY